MSYRVVGKRNGHIIEHEFSDIPHCQRFIESIGINTDDAVMIIDAKGRRYERDGRLIEGGRITWSSWVASWWPTAFQK